MIDKVALLSSKLLVVFVLMMNKYTDALDKLIVNDKALIQQQSQSKPKSKIQIEFNDLSGSPLLTLSPAHAPKTIPLFTPNQLHPIQNFSQQNVDNALLHELSQVDNTTTNKPALSLAPHFVSSDLAFKPPQLSHGIGTTHQYSTMIEIEASRPKPQYRSSQTVEAIQHSILGLGANGEDYLIATANGVDVGIAATDDTVVDDVLEEGDEEFPVSTGTVNSVKPQELKSIASKLMELSTVQLEQESKLISSDEDEEDVFDVVKVVEAPVEQMSLDELSDEVMKLKIDTAHLKPEVVSVRKDDTEYPWVRVDSPTAVVNFHNQVPKLALDFSFELDVFQKQAVLHLEKGESVFIAAHTSAGKTVVAEYAIALALRHRTRVVYTSPIKALSNQKFRDFQQRFSQKDVGLITGDVSLNPDAACLVMTTEILRSMLYRGADVVKDIEWVVFDEVHYINDIDRGVVWEEVIIMLPPHVNLIFLSATSPNTKEFSSWIGRTKEREVFVITTEKRPVPLNHFLFSGKEFHKILDGKNKFISSGYTSARRSLMSLKDLDKEKDLGKPMKRGRREQVQAQQRWANKGPGSRNSGTTSDYWMTLVRRLQKDDLTPTVVFTFSKKKCDERAGSLSKIDLSSGVERSRIHVLFKRALSRLIPSDRKLPQVTRVQELATRGIAVHHGGLLPILKEIVEILFSRGLIKLLFATETFAIGVNMPARSVIFNGLRKHDGLKFRDLLPGEYIQMAGRAGRRGLDKVGTVIIASVDELPPIETLTTMLVGKARRLESQFKLSYNLILNLLRVAELSVAQMMKRSFSEFTTQKLLGGSAIIDVIKQGEERLSTLRRKLLEQQPCVFGGDSGIEQFQRLAYRLTSQLSPLLQDLVDGKHGSKPSNIVFCVGRVVVIISSQHNIIFEACRVLSVNKEECYVTIETCKQEQVVVGLSSVLVVCVQCVDNCMELNNLIALERMNDIEDNPYYNSSSTKALLLNSVDPVQHLKVGQVDFVENWREYSNELIGLHESKCITCTLNSELYVQYENLNQLALTLRKAKQAMSDENLALFPDFQARLRVLGYLKYIDRIDNAVKLKGRASSEINTCDELILTEIVFENVLGELNPAECAAALSALVLQGKSKDEPMINERLEQVRGQMLQIAIRLEELQTGYGVELPGDWITKSLNFGLMEVVYEWALGLEFNDICGLTSLEEGTIVRCITRLEETCREVRTIAKVIGDASLFNKMKQVSNAMKRDIIFATSLYVT